jgi:hypothetical protein
LIALSYFYLFHLYGSVHLCIEKLNLLDIDSLVELIKVVQSLYLVLIIGQSLSVNLRNLMVLFPDHLGNEPVDLLVEFLGQRRVMGQLWEPSVHSPD